MKQQGLTCVVGAGISGLAAAQELLDQGRDVVVIEAADRPGGVIETRCEDGLLFECGPNSFPSSSTEVVELAQKAGIGDHIINAREAAETRFLYHDHHLVRIPTGPGELFKTDLFTFWQKLRILWEPFVSKRRSDKPESVASFFARRFGLAPTRTLVDAFVSGIYAGDARQVGIAATFPQLKKMEDEYGSIFKAMKARRKKGESSRMTIQNFRNGLSELPEGIARNLGDRLRLGRRARKLKRVSGGGFILTVEGPEGIEEIHAARVILATPAQAAGLLLTAINPLLADLLFDIDYAPVVSVHGAFPAEELPTLPEAFGFLVPRPSRMRTLGWLFTSKTFEGRAPEGFQTLNGFIGGSLDPEVVQASDEALRHVLLGELSIALGMTQFPQPSYFKLVRHEPGLPQYIVGHAQRVKAIKTLLKEHADLVLIGNYLEGVSLNDCIKNARKAVGELIQGEMPAAALEESP